MSQVLALVGGAAGPRSDAVFSTLVGLINNGTFSGLPDAPTGGIVYTKYIWPALTAGGRLDLAYKMWVNTGFPSFEYWIQGVGPGGAGATTLWEHWQSTFSNPYRPPGAYNPGTFNHIMFGGGGKWMFNALGGLSPAGVGWSNLTIAPPAVPLPGLTQAFTSIDSPIGMIAVNWTTVCGGSCVISIAAVVPCGAQAVIQVPYFNNPLSIVTIVDESSDRPVWTKGAFVPGTPGVSAGAAGANTIAISVGSGSYTLVAQTSSLAAPSA